MHPLLANIHILVAGNLYIKQSLKEYVSKGKIRVLLHYEVNLSSYFLYLKNVEFAFFVFGAEIICW